jgi:prephenate dehydratase
MVQAAEWIDSGLTSGTPINSIATLGPAGTSSEQAAMFLWVGHHHGEPPAIHLSATYEEAGDAVISGAASHVVVANAYAGIHRFYMDPAFSIVGAFLMDTPLYGIAVSPERQIPSVARISSHPAPIPLIRELLPTAYSVAEILHATSTSAAAIQAHRGEADMALTTEPAATANALKFISRTRSIRMLWSVFTLTPAQQ